MFEQITPIAPEYFLADEGEEIPDEGKGAPNTDTSDQKFPVNELRIAEVTRITDGNRKFAIPIIERILALRDTLSKKDARAFDLRHNLHHGHIAYFRKRLGKAAPGILAKEEGNTACTNASAVDVQNSVTTVDPVTIAILAEDLFGPLLSRSDSGKKGLNPNDVAMVLEHIDFLKSKRGQVAVEIFCKHYKINRQQLKRWRKMVATLAETDEPAKNVFMAVLIDGNDENFVPDNKDLERTDAPAGSMAKINAMADRVRMGCALHHIKDRHDFEGITGGISPETARHRTEI